MTKHIGEVVGAWEDLGLTQRLNSSERPQQPSARQLEIMGKLGLRYPPANSVDRDAHAARVALLAEDCADIPDDWLDWAARQWAKNSPFFPRTCELRDSALAYGRNITRGRTIAAPISQEPPRPDPEPLTDDELSRLSPKLIEMGVKLGEIDAGQAEKLRAA